MELAQLASPFLATLPAELRLKVYGHYMLDFISDAIGRAIPSDFQVNNDPRSEVHKKDDSANTPPLLRTCKEVAREISEIIRRHGFTNVANLSTVTTDIPAACRGLPQVMGIRTPTLSISGNGYNFNVVTPGRLRIEWFAAGESANQTKPRLPTGDFPLWAISVPKHVRDMEVIEIVHALLWPYLNVEAYKSMARLQQILGDMVDLPAMFPFLKSVIVSGIFRLKWLDDAEAALRDAVSHIKLQGRADGVRRWDRKEFHEFERCAHNGSPDSPAYLQVHSIEDVEHHRKSQKLSQDNEHHERILDQIKSE